MADGTSPKFERLLPLGGLKPETWAAISAEALRILGWNVQHISASGFTAYTNYGSDSEVKLFIENNEARLVSASLTDQAADPDQDKKYIAHFLEQFEHVRASMSSAELETLTAGFTSHLPQVQDEMENVQSPLTKNNGNFLQLFVPQKDYLVTPILVNLNILIFIIMVATGVNAFEPSTESLLAWGADFRPLIVQGETWRLLSNAFLHIGFFHLALNMYALIYIGLLLEHRLGSARFAVAYLCTGIIASVASVAVHPYTVGAGASGAIFGMYGVLLALLISKQVDEAVRGALLSSVLPFVGYNLFYGFTKSGIDNAAHIGGLLSGMAIGFAYLPSLKSPINMRMRHAVMIAVTLVTIIVAVACRFSFRDDLGMYDKAMNQFDAAETRALKLYNLPNTASTEVQLDEIKNHGLPEWKRGIAIIQGADGLDLPQQFHERNQKLIKYCRLRIKIYGLLYKAIDENTQAYKPGIDSCDKAISAIIDDLKKP